VIFLEVLGRTHVIQRPGIPGPDVKGMSPAGPDLSGAKIAGCKGAESLADP